MRPLVSFVLAGLCAGVLFTATAEAKTDAAGDFLATHAGPNNADLDIVQANVFNFGSALGFTARFDGKIGQTTGASYVWGIDRGAGTPGLFAGTPPVGAQVTFDAVLVLRADGTGTVTAFNEVGAPTVTSLQNGVASFRSFLGALVDTSLLPSRGFAVQDYRYNLWTRSGGGNAGIADLAQGSGTFGAVPEPATWAMMIGGFAMTGWRTRRRAKRVLA